MCHGPYGPSGAQLLVIGSICVVLSPILIPAGIVYGGVKLAEAAAVEVKQAKAAKRSLGKRLEAIRKYKPTPEHKEMLQALYDASAANRTSFQAKLDVAMCVFLASDFPGAAALLQEAIALGMSTTDELVGSAHYFLALCFQQMGFFPEAIRSFDDSIRLLQQQGKPCSTSGRAARLCLSDALNAKAYAMYLDTLYSSPPPPSAGYEALISPDHVAALKAAEEVATAAIAAATVMEPEEDMKAALFEVRALIRYRLFFKAASEGGEEHQSKEFDVQSAQKALADASKALELEPSAELAFLKAHCLYLLRDVTGAGWAALRQASDLDLDGGLPDTFIDFDCITDLSLERLVRPWPLPVSASGETVSPHDFEELRFSRPTWCDHCMKFVTPLQNIAKCFRCRVCEFSCHRECLAEASNKMCLRTMRKRAMPSGGGSGDVPPSTSAHHHAVVLRTMPVVHHCDWCRKFIMMLTDAYQCETCPKVFFHKECAKIATDVVIAKK